MAFECENKAVSRKQDPCDSTREGARIIHLAYTKKGQWATIAPDGATASAITTALLAAEQIGNALILRNTTGELSETQNTVEGRGLQISKSTTLDHVATVLDHEPVRNTGFWDAIKKQPQNWDVIIFTQSRGWQQAGASINIESTMVIADDLNDYVKISSVTSFRSENHLSPFDYVQTDLAVYPTAGDVVLTENGDGAVAGTSPDFTYSVADTGLVDITATLSSGSEVDSIVLLDGYTLPAGLTITGATLAGTATGVGVETFKLCVVSIYGLETVVTIQYTVTA